jgi:hypothetical protein
MLALLAPKITANCHSSARGALTGGGGSINGGASFRTLSFKAGGRRIARGFFGLGFLAFVRRIRFEGGIGAGTHFFDELDG